jgi:hypothetical protein
MNTEQDLNPLAEKDEQTADQQEPEQKARPPFKYEPPDIEIVDAGEVALREYH